jgi:hypothetical protein
LFPQRSCPPAVAFEGIEARGVDVRVQVAPGLPAVAIGVPLTGLSIL